MGRAQRQSQRFQSNAVDHRRPSGRHCRLYGEVPGVRPRHTAQVSGKLLTTVPAGEAGVHTASDSSSIGNGSSRYVDIARQGGTSRSRSNDLIRRSVVAKAMRLADAEHCRAAE